MNLPIPNTTLAHSILFKIARIQNVTISNFTKTLYRLTLAVLAGSIWLASGANLAAQQNRHNGRITKSFTEPIEKSTAASSGIGIIVQSFVKEGDRVQVGDRLAAINHSVIKESLAIAVARADSTSRLDLARGQLEIINSQLRAIQSLVDGGHTNQFEVDQKQAEYRTAYSELQSAQDEAQLNRLEVKRIQAELNERFITSPINGVVTELHKQLGENISNSEPEYATVVRVDELKVRFYLDSGTLKRTAVGDRVTVLIGSHRSSSPAIVTYVSPIIDPDSGLGRLDVKIDNRDMQIQSGVICEWSERGTREARAQRDTPTLLKNRSDQEPSPRLQLLNH